MPPNCHGLQLCWDINDRHSGGALPKILYVAIAVLLIQCCPAAAANQDCMSDYYRNKPPGCIDNMLQQLRQLPPGSKADPSTMIGFLAWLFRASPVEKQRILNDESSDYVRSVDLVALYRADLPDEARKFADKYHLSAMFQKLETTRPAPLATVKPTSAPTDNDLLIGAYMASGDTTLIQRILQNFSSADDGMVSDAMRMGYMNSKFGPNLTPTGRDNVMAPAACAKYQCKTDLARMLRVLTLSSAFWALQSLAQRDDGVNTTFNGFFAGDPRLKNLLIGEQAAFGNYLTTLVTLAALKPNPGSEASTAYTSMSKAALAYENLEPSQTMFGHIQGVGKPAQSAN
uniref:Uncharacterized protein n=1 Tax=Rhodopseudomonas palustris (strain BisA53) TaxID=316055 RepID=Q07H68_RHOP5